MEDFLAARAPPRTPPREVTALLDPLPSVPLPKNSAAVLGPFDLGLQPSGPRPWPEIGDLAPPNTTGWIRRCLTIT